MNRESILNLFPKHIRKIITDEEIELHNLQEIRLRNGRPMTIKSGNREREIPIYHPYVVTQEDIEEILQYATNYSLYAYEKEMSQGFLTVEGGHRIGLAGQVIMDGEHIRNLKYISSLNIRISHQIIGCADAVMKYLMQGNRFLNTLIIAPPGKGKTTLLRDIIRQLSDGNGGKTGVNVGVVDERSELGGSYMGKIQNNLGKRTDLLDGVPKVLGITMLVRSMGPSVIAIDEIGSEQEARTLEYAMYCGCGILATIHGESIQEMREKPIVKEMFLKRLFQRYIVLAGQGAGCIAGVYDGAGCLLC